jgi:membrane fusion protein, heavy metal efflux system
MKPLWMVLLIGAALSTAHAGPGHDHGDEAPAAAVPGGLQRQSDGSLNVPKPAQRQMGVRVLAVQSAALARVTLLQGLVQADPSAGGLVQATQAGRLVPPPQGFPVLGQRLRRGQVLGFIEPTLAPLERSAQAAQVAELQVQTELAQQRVARLTALADTVPRREIEAAQSELQALRARRAALSQGLSGREALTAPVDGVLASHNAQAGQVLDARDTVFTVVNPARLRIEALAYDAALAADVGAAYLVDNAAQTTATTTTPKAQPLTFLGGAGALRDQALPLHFALAGGLPLAVGQPVQVLVHSRSTQAGHAVPAAALVKNAANQSTVWVKVAPERFVPKVVQAQPLDGVRVVVTQGLSDGDLVVSQGATLLNQVR